MSIIWSWTKSYRDKIFKLLRIPGIDSKESISPAYVSLAGQNDKPIPTRFLAPIDCLKIPAQSYHMISGYL